MTDIQAEIRKQIEICKTELDSMEATLPQYPNDRETFLRELSRSLQISLGEQLEGRFASKQKKNYEVYKINKIEYKVFFGNQSTGSDIVLKIKSGLHEMYPKENEAEKLFTDEAIK